MWVYMPKDRFSTKRKSKLNACGDGSFQIIAKINDNAYRVDLLGEYDVSITFNVSDLSYFDFDTGSNLKMNPFKERVND